MRHDGAMQIGKGDSMVRNMLLWLLLMGVASPVLAQRLPPPALMVQENDRAKPLEISAVDTDVRIVGDIAETRTTMTFYNPQSRNMAGDLYFPLPEGATVSGYALDIEGKMVDGVVVEKDKARQVFEIEVRKGIDPGLVEWVKGNNFKTRVFPVPPKGSRTVMVRYVTPLVRDVSGPNYQLPLNYKSPVGTFHLRVEVVKPGAPPVVKSGTLANFSFAAWRESFVAETTIKGKPLVDDLTIAVPDTRPASVRVEAASDGTHYFYARMDRPRVLAAGDAKAPARIAILWDASGSMADVDRSSEIAVIDALLKRLGEVDVDLVLFRNEMEQPREFLVSGGDGRELIAALKGVAYDGGTQMGALRPLTGKVKVAFYLLCGDGLSNFGKEEPSRFDAPIFALGPNSQTNHPFMRYLALASGGAYYNLTRMEPEAVAKQIGKKPFSYLRTEVIQGRVEGIYPSVPQPMPGEFFLAGRLLSDQATIRIHFGLAGGEGDSQDFIVEKSAASTGSIMRIFWAQKKLEELLIFPEKNADELLATGQEFGLVTPGSSLMVLERLEQYVEHRIEPPESLPEMRAEYRAQVDEFHRQRAAEEEDKIQHVLSLWQTRIEWWNKEFKYPKDLRVNQEEAKEAMSGSAMGMGGSGSGGGSARGMASISLGVAGSADDGGAPSEAEAPMMEEREARREAPPAAKKSKAKDDDGDAAYRAPEPTIALKPWNPETPYVKALEKAGKRDLFTVYIAQRKEFGDSPAFFLDCADFFYRKENKALALQVLSNIVELGLEDPALYRVTAHRLTQKGELELARLLFEKVLKLRPEEPQSYRDLALVLDQMEVFDRAVELLYHVVLNQWDRFDGIEVIALMELNRILARAKRAGKGISRVDKRLTKLLDVDVRIILTWDTDLTDMDLWVTEPSGEKADYSNNNTTIGGLVSRDFTQGYGPEEYVLKKSMAGKYKIEANYYGSSAPTLTGAVTLQVDIFTNYGRENEQRQTLTLRLTQSKDVVHVGDVTF
jgi:Ca-activated chloride channel family protein